MPPPVRHDLMMFQVAEVSLVPQADNPLPRMVLDLDLFNRAVRRGKLSVPGLPPSFHKSIYAAGHSCSFNDSVCPSVVRPACFCRRRNKFRRRL